MSSQFQPILEMPRKFTVFDFTQGVNEVQIEAARFGVGRYNEVRPNSYLTPLFEKDRNIHMGIDLFAPVQTPVMSFTTCELVHFGYNPAAGDYGNTLVVKAVLDQDLVIYALYGHLSAESLKSKRIGQKFAPGEVIGGLGNRDENGGWIPHVHFQLSWVCPDGPDLPGVVTPKQREIALLKYPDPRLVLGALYP